MRLRALILLLAIATSAPAIAVQPDEVLPDASLETRARSLSKELRCMVCQNQSIDDSDAPLARDLRILVRERLTAGDSDRAVLDFLVTRYGEFVLLRPPLSPRTVVLWLAPALTLGIGLAAVVTFWRRRRTVAESSADSLSPAEEARLRTLEQSPSKLNR